MNVTAAPSADAGASVAPRARTRFGGALEGATSFIWRVILPALLSSWILRYAVPTPAEALRGFTHGVAVAVAQHTAFAWVALFALLSSMASYWSFAIMPTAETSTTGRRVTVELLCVVGIVAGGAWFLRTAFGAYEVLSASMLPTLEPGDIIGGNRFVYGRGVTHSAGTAGEIPRRGDLIVFHKPGSDEGAEQLVKRVIGLPGDRITMNEAHPIINGWEVPTCDAGLYVYPIAEGGGAVGRLHVEFLDDHAHLALYGAAKREWTESYEVKPGEVFVLGDNRDNSSDSRAWNNGKGEGLRVASIEAQAKRWLYGLKRNGHIDPSNMLRPLELFARLDGLDTTELFAGIDRCLHRWPSNTRPPAPHGH
jgi:signal peptidase I